MKPASAPGSGLIPRRAFLTGLTASAGAVSTSRLFAADAPADGPWRAAVIGHTGQGDYGHSLDAIFNGREDVQVVAVVDPQAAGRAKAAERSKAQRQYADYRMMLDQEKPQLVCLAPRWSLERRAMALAALKAGAHLITEKPFTPTLAEADEILAAADKSGRKIAVAHQMRNAPSIVQLKKALADGLIGDLLQLRAWGKQDDRAGGEDMIVLGSHLFDLMRGLAGDPVWCSARVTQNGREITKADARTVKEQIGPVAGNEIEAHFAFARTRFQK